MSWGKMIVLNNEHARWVSHDCCLKVFFHDIESDNVMEKFIKEMGGDDEMTPRTAVVVCEA